MKTHDTSTLEKALAVNLDPHRYGTFAEIGAGQEVVRWFFRAGGAAGTISKSISAYDMQVSDAIYGKCTRYVCRERLEAMLDHEQKLNRDRLTDHRGDRSSFFCFADTVSARNYHGTNESHGWMGVLFQGQPGAPDSRIVIHIRMLDPENAQQQEALGIVGVNLVHAAFFYSDDADKLIESLRDSLNKQRIEIDVIEFSGPEFSHIDNRVMALKLVQRGLTGAALFAPDGAVLQPSGALRKRPLVVERGRFRPVTHVNIDMMQASLATFEAVNDVRPGETLPIMELSMNCLTADGEVNLDDFISRAEVLEATGYTVMISDYFEYYRLAQYLFRNTQRPIGIAMGLDRLKDLFSEKYYQKLDGGILESFGKLFRNDLKLFVYPRKLASGKVETVHDLEFSPTLSKLYDYLVSRDCIVDLDNINPAYLDIHSPQVLEQIACDDPGWCSQVPAEVATAIRTKGLFGYPANVDAKTPA